MTTKELLIGKFDEISKGVDFDEEKHQYKVSLVEGGAKMLVPSVTQLKAPYGQDFTAIPVDVLNNKIEIGNAVHKQAEGAVKESSNPFAALEDMENVELSGYKKAMENYQKDYESNKNALYLREFPIYNPHLLYAGTPDCLRILDGKLTIRDYKTAASIDQKSIKIQLVGYYLALLSLGVDDYVEVSDEAQIIQIKKDGTYRVIDVTLTETDAKVFMALTQLYRFFK